MPKIPTAHDVYSQAATGFAQQMGDLVNAGPQLVDALHKAGLKGVSMADAFQIAQNSLLDLSHAFDSHGNLTKTAQNMLSNYAATIGPMTQNGGAFGAAIAGQQIMSSAAMQNLSKVNSGDGLHDQQIMPGPPRMAGVGPAAMTANPVYRGDGESPRLVHHPRQRGGMEHVRVHRARTQPGIITQMQQFNDQMRTGLTLGALTPGQAAGNDRVSRLKQCPARWLKKSPAALAMLMQQAAQQGSAATTGQAEIPGAELRRACAKSRRSADSAKQTNAAILHDHQPPNLPTVAQQFAQGTAAQIQSQEVAKAAQDAMNIKGGINIKANAADLVSQLKAAGVQGGAALKASLDAILSTGRRRESGAGQDRGPGDGRSARQA